VRTTRYRTALGSARGPGACLDVARALGYVADIDAGMLKRLDIVTGTLVRVIG
jgi:hypothetical protein